MRIEFQACERFDLRNDPASLLAAIDFVRESVFAPILQSQADCIERISRAATLLHADDGHNRGYIGSRNPPRGTESKNARARKDFTVGHADSIGFRQIEMVEGEKSGAEGRGH